MNHAWRVSQGELREWVATDDSGAELGKKALPYKPGSTPWPDERRAARAELVGDLMRLANANNLDVVSVVHCDGDEFFIFLRG